MNVFRYRQSVDVPYVKQGSIFFMMMRYGELPEQKKKRIEVLCKRAGGSVWEALLQYMTTDATPEEVMQKHYIASYTTLGRAVKRFMENFPDDLL